MILNFYNATKSYTAMALSTFSNIQLKIDDTKLYTIPIVFANMSRLKSKLLKPDKSFTYRAPIFSLEVDIDAQSSINRMTNPMLRRKVIEIDNTKLGITYNDKPCDYLVTLNVVADTMTSLTNIVEGINAMFYHNVLYATYKTPLGDEIRTPMKLEDIGFSPDNMDDVPEGDRLLEATFMIRIEGVVHSNYNTQSSKITDIEFLITNYNKEVDNLIERFSITA